MEQKDKDFLREKHGYLIAEKAIEWYDELPDIVKVSIKNLDKALEILKK